MISYIIDVVFLLAAIITIIIFTKRGFVKSILNRGKILVSVILTCIFGKTVGELLYTRIFFGRICNWMNSKISTAFASLTDKINVETLTDELPFVVRHFVSPEAIKAQYGTVIYNTQNTAMEIAELVSAPIARLISNFVAYIAVFVLAILLLLVFGGLLDATTKLPIINGTNKFLGFLLGALAAFVLLSSITYILSLFIGIFGNVIALENLTETSYLFGFFRKIHLFNLF